MASTVEDNRVNPYLLSQAGQDGVQDIVLKSQEIFHVSLDMRVFLLCL